MRDLSQHRFIAVELDEGFGAFGNSNPDLEPVRMTASHIMTAVLLAFQALSVAVVPRTLAEMNFDAAVRWAVVPITDSPTLQMHTIWSPATDPDSAHRWLRGKIAEIANRLECPETA